MMELLFQGSNLYILSNKEQAGISVKMADLTPPFLLPEMLLNYSKWIF